MLSHRQEANQATHAMIAAMHNESKKQRNYTRNTQDLEQAIRATTFFRGGVSHHFTIGCVFGTSSTASSSLAISARALSILPLGETLSELGLELKGDEDGAVASWLSKWCCNRLVWV